MDTYNYKLTNNRKPRENIIRIKESLNLVDPWRTNNPVKKRYTWHHNNGKKGRLDFFLISEELLSIFEQSDIIPGYRSDHSIITLELRLNNFKCGKGFWKFNNSLIKDDVYIKKVKKVISETINEYLLIPYNRANIAEIDQYDLQFSISDQLLFETILMNIRSMTIPIVSLKKKKKKKIRKN